MHQFINILSKPGLTDVSKMSARSTLCQPADARSQRAHACAVRVKMPSIALKYNRKNRTNIYDLIQYKTSFTQMHARVLYARTSCVHRDVRKFFVLGLSTSLRACARARDATERGGRARACKFHGVRHVALELIPNNARYIRMHFHT